MFIRDIRDCEYFTSLDNTILCELLPASDQRTRRIGNSVQYRARNRKAR
jgi:hypothetical protein